MIDAEILKQNIWNKITGESITKKELAELLRPILLILGKNTEEKNRFLAEARQLYATILDTQGKKHDTAYQALEKKLDTLFVSEKMKGIEENVNKLLKSVELKASKLKDGYTPKKGKDFFDGERGADGSPDTPAQVREKLKQAGIDAEAIEGLEDLITKEVKKIMGNVRFGRGGGNMAAAAPINLLQSIDISSQMDGFKKTFVGLPTARFYPVVYSSQAPFTLHPNVHYSIGNRTITLNNTVEAPTSGTNQFLIVEFIK